MTRERWRVRVYGKVQGVFFRKYAQMTARSLRLTGFTQNMPDGSVLNEVEGVLEDLERFVQWAHRGSPAAQVTRVEVEKALPLQGDSDFHIRG
ncbi:MAG: acylphosphatase [Bacteroidia bacterium]|nr:acylphosphatase [Bacteroidia bacterium]